MAFRRVFSRSAKQDGKPFIRPTKQEFDGALNWFWDQHTLTEFTFFIDPHIFGVHQCNLSKIGDDLAMEICRMQDEVEDISIFSLRIRVADHIFHVPACVDMVSMALQLEGWEPQFTQSESLAA